MHRKLAKITKIKTLPIKGQLPVRSLQLCIPLYYVNQGGEEKQVIKMSKF